MMQRIFVFVCFILIVFSCSDSEQSQSKNYKLDTEVAIPKVPETANFCSEQIPLNRLDVKEALDFEIIKNTYWHSNTILILKRTKKYFLTIEKILKEENVPDDLKYLAVAESNLDLKISSPAKAKGMWQFLKGTAKDYGLQVDEEVDERSNLEKSTRAAIKYLKELKDSTGTWSLAAASYNAGLGNVRKAMKEQAFNPNEDSYFDLKLFRETERYVYRITALKTILESPENYGFNLNEGDYYSNPKLKEIKITETIENLYDWSKKQGFNYKTLTYYNPWILSGTLTVEQGNSYTILLPETNE